MPAGLLLRQNGDASLAAAVPCYPRAFRSLLRDPRRPSPGGPDRTCNRVPIPRFAWRSWRHRAEHPPRSGGSRGGDAHEDAAVRADAAFIDAFAFPGQGQAGVLERQFAELADGVGLAGGDDVVVRLIGLQHELHGADVARGVAPVALRVEVSEVETILETGLDARHEWCQSLRPAIVGFFVSPRQTPGCAGWVFVAGLGDGS